MNAARENVPLLFTAGRTPILEEGLPGHRTSAIHWGQEMFDQAGMVREFVKWDYELRSAEQVETIIDRALAAAGSEPKGPVYLSLPRGVLAAPMASFGYTSPMRRVAATPAGPDPVAVDQLAQRLEAAKRPVLITSNLGRDESAVAKLAAFAQSCAVPVVQYRARYLNLPHDHPMHGGYEPATFLEQADLAIVLESDVPWVPASTRMRDDCYVVHAGHDPLFLRYPVRGFRCDAALTTGAGVLLDALTMRLAGRIDAAVLDARLARMSTLRSQRAKERAARLDAVRTLSPIHPAWVSHCLSHALDDEAIVVNEYPISTEFCGFSRPGSFFASSTASGLGWGFGAALGAKLAHRERLVVATLGDGAYMFSNPLAGHYAARQNDLPILVVVFNNAMWNAVRRATRGMYPNGHAARSDAPAYTKLDGLPAFEDVCVAAGGYGERVEHAEALPAALARAIDVVMRKRRQALLNVMCCVS
jgi:acetolactate synthase-1/2/3 large subunit